MTTPADLLARAQAFLADDPDPNTRAELSALLARTDDAAHAELADRFDGTLQFGTAGLRGVLGAGTNRMNRAVAARATAGLCAYLVKHGVQSRGVAIGYDGRRLSREIAQDCAELCAGAGIPAFLFPDVTATPVLAFTVLDQQAAAGVMVTASHNPPEYNGYKVYWGNGAQIIPPHDTGIAACIAEVPSVLGLPRMSAEQARAAGLLRVLGEDVVERYLTRAVALQVHAELPRTLRIAYTALHGVGARFVRASMERGGFRDVQHVAEQDAPDGEFPTVAFPNPEEKGAMDLVLALAKKTNAELVLANDPDADRLAVAVPRGDGYLQLTGNDVGCLLAHYLLSEGPQDGKRMVLSSIVSSPMLGAIAAAHGAYWEPTLTGFKWIANRALELEAERELRFLMGYEEALGYTVGPLVRDKDGVSAALVFADLAAWCASRKTTVLAELEVCWRRYGLYLSRQVSVTKKGADGAQQIRAIMAKVRGALPESLGGLAVTSVLDLERGVRTRSGREEPAGLPPSDVLALDLDGGHRVMLRPSGTEPKIKYYFDVAVQIAPSESVADARARGEALVDALITAFQALVG